VPVVRVVSGAIILMSIGAVSLNGVNGTANTRVTLYIEIVAITFYSIYIYLMFERWRMPFIIGWFCEILYWLGIFIMAYGYLRSGKWKGKVV
jgi:multidrug resistance protein, MATE family